MIKEIDSQVLWYEVDADTKIASGLVRVRYEIINDNGAPEQICKELVEIDIAENTRPRRCKMLLRKAACNQINEYYIDDHVDNIFVEVTTHKGQLSAEQEAELLAELRSIVSEY